MLQVSTLPKTTERTQRIVPTFGSVNVERMEAGQESEVIDFLEQRPIHTVAMVSLIRDNGLVSQLNRGTFYACRDMNGHLEGVALVGHATLMETVSDRALQALAQVAKDCPHTHMIMGEQDRIEELWGYCSKAGHKLRLACRESLLELRWPIAVYEPVPNLHLATLKELHLVMPIQARMAFEESGVNPLEVDPEGFRKRCVRRIELGRTWVLVEHDELVFKAEIISETPQVIYLEGVWLSEHKRGNDFGVSCISELSRKLLSRSRSICLLVNENNKRAQAFYRKCGYLFRATYETIFLPQKDKAPTSVN
jgi:ribosomal protein S18 acetylase RimI-like enzyme